MLEGLEVEEIQFQNVLNNPNLRLEAEFFIKKTNLFESSIGAEIIDFVQYGTSEELNEDKRGYPILRLNEFDGSFLGIPAKYSEKISLDTYRSLEIKKGDVLICRTNGNLKYVGKAAIAMQDYSFAFASYLFRIRPNKFINPETLTVFLNSKSGRREIEKYAMKGNQSNFSPAKFREIKIPHFSTVLQDEIKALVSSSFEKLQKSKEAYQTAQNLLLEHLDLKDFNPPTQTVNIKSFSDSFGTSGRLDAEFYQEKYDVLVQKLKAQEYDELKNLVSVKKSIEPGSSAYDEQGLPFIRVSDYDKFQISSPAKYLSEAYCRENHETLKNLLPKKGTILFSKDGTVGIAYLLSEDLNGISSGAILHLKVKDKRVLPEYLTLVLNSFAVQMQAERDVGGSIIQHWRVEEIKEVVIPIISMEIQTQIADLIRKSDRLRQESQALLEEANRKVEQAIEG